jgi:hypothetical protein
VRVLSRSPRDSAQVDPLTAIALVTRCLASINNRGRTLRLVTRTLGRTS